VNLIPVIDAVKLHANEWKSALGHRLAENTRRLLLEFREVLMVSVCDLNGSLCYFCHKYDL
jgi:hypothetical protein